MLHIYDQILSYELNAAKSHMMLDFMDWCWLLDLDSSLYYYKNSSLCAMSEEKSRMSRQGNTFSIFIFALLT